ncbi:MAG TPA: hypothetical protein VFA15_00205, partial [Nitrososphaera sp.]|nr:hypothetical protein [Nitrososphaera sp.]
MRGFILIALPPFSKIVGFIALKRGLLPAPVCSSILPYRLFVAARAKKWPPRQPLNGGQAHITVLFLAAFTSLQRGKPFTVWAFFFLLAFRFAFVYAVES